MINFRYHIVSLVAVFLALAIGVIMGTAVIDNAVVDRLEAQQRTLDGQVAKVRGDNAQLRDDVDGLQAVSSRLVEEGMARLKDVPIVVIGVRGGTTEGLDEVRDLLDVAGARMVGTLWLTDRWALKDGKSADDLRAAVGATSTTLTVLRSQGLQALASALRWSPIESQADSRVVLEALRKAGFVDFESTQGQSQPVPKPESEDRFLLYSGQGAGGSDRTVSLPFARALIFTLNDRAPAKVVVAEPGLPDKAGDDELVVPLREDDLASRQLSTVDDLAEVTGRYAVALALADLGRSQVGHFGRGPHAQSLLPVAPAS
jgi:hypothetical protein